MCFASLPCEAREPHERIVCRMYIRIVSSCFSLLEVKANVCGNMVFGTYTKQRILSLHWRGQTVSSIVEQLVLEDGIRVSKQGVRQFLKHYAKYNTIARKPGSGLNRMFRTWL